MINGNLYDVVEESMQTIIGHLKFAFEITGKTTQRIEIPEYPLDALREALLNTLIHRDYQSSTDVQIKVFDNKITFFNPGGLYGNVTIKELLTDSYHASTRNKQIAEAFYLTNDIEKYGSGFTRIRQAIEEYPTMKFNFSDVGSGFVSEFTYATQKISSKKLPEKLSVNEGVNEGVKKLFTTIKTHSGKRLPFYAKKIGVPQKTIERWLLKLRTEGKIEFKGAAKTGGYFIVEK